MSVCFLTVSELLKDFSTTKNTQTLARNLFIHINEIIKANKFFLCKTEAAGGKKGKKKGGSFQTVSALFRVCIVSYFQITIKKHTLKYLWPIN